MRERALRAGVTLVELLVVVFLFAVVAGFAIPRIDFVRFEVQGAVQQVGTTLLAAQRTAIKRQHDVVVAFDAASGVIRVHEDTNNNRQIDPGEAVRYVTLGEHVTFGRVGAPTIPTLGEGVISFTRTQGELPAVIFGRGGHASEHGGIYLTSRRAQLHGPIDGHDHAIEVERATGRVNWLRYTDERWARGF